MDNELDAMDRGWRKKVLIVDDSVHMIGLLGRSIEHMYQPAPALFDETRPSGRRRGQRKHNYQWN